MKSSWRWWVCLPALGIMAVTLGAPVVAQEADPQVEKVFADWKKRQQLAKSVSYRVLGDLIITKGSCPNSMGVPGGDFPPKDVTCKVKRFFLLDFLTNRYRLEIEEEQYDQGTDKLYPKVQAPTFDGTLIKSYRPRERNTHPLDGVGPTDPELGIGKGDFAKKAALEMIHWPMLVGHGSVPTRSTAPLPGQLMVLPDIDLVHVHGRAVHQGRACLVLRTDPRSQSFEEFWVDPARDSAIVRKIWYLANKPCTDTEIEYGNPVHRWLPRQWTFTLYDTGRLVQTERVRVEAVTLDPPISDEEFQIEERPGMLVAHVTHGAQRAPDETPPEATVEVFRVEAGGQLQAVVVIDGVVKEIPSFGWLWWLVVLLLPLGVATWWVLSRKRGNAGKDHP